MKKYLLLLLLLTAVSAASGKQSLYKADILGDGFEQRTIVFPDDYEGDVTCTLIRKRLPEGKKAVLYIHGFNDYFFQEEMANWYVEHGYHFYAVDLRKYGRSILPHQKMNNVRDLREYFADIDTALRIIKSEGAEHVLLSGHSAGGLITTYYAQEHPHSELFGALFLNSPFFAFNESWLVKWLALPAIAKKGAKNPDKLKKGGFSKWYGHSLHVSAHGEWDYNLDWKPHVAPEVNYGWIRAFHEAQKAVSAGKEITVPFLVMFSMHTIHPKKWSEKLFTGDAVLDVKDIRHGYGALKGQSQSSVQIDGLVHDVFLSKKEGREEAYTQLWEWMVTHMGF